MKKSQIMKRTKTPEDQKNDFHYEFIERKIITGLIVSTEYFKLIREVWNYQLIGSSTAKRMATWCIEYYDQYLKAPGKHIQDIFNEKSKSLGEADADDIADIFDSLSKDFDQEDDFNPEYLFDETIKYFRYRQLRNLNDQLLDALDNNDTGEAEELLKEYNPLEIASYSKISDFIMNLEQMNNLDIEKPRLLMSPWLREGQITFIYGQYGSGKSLLTLNIAMLLGLTIDDTANWDIGEWQVKNPTGCLYIDGEMGVVELRERMDQFDYLGKQEFPVLGFPIPLYQLATEDDFYLSERKNQLQIISWFKDHPDYKLLILDSVTTLFGLTDENNNAEWNTRINPFLRDLKALGIATIILHHSGKDEKKGLRGASAMGAMAHNIFSLINHKDKNIDDGEAYFTLVKIKQRAAGIQFKSFDIHYKQDSGMKETRWETERSMKRSTEDLNDNEIGIVKKLINGKASQNKIADKMGCTQSFVSQVKKKAKDLGYLNVEGKGTKLWNELLDDFIRNREDD